jgi:hypothetical protein
VLKMSGAGGEALAVGGGAEPVVRLEAAGETALVGLSVGRSSRDLPLSVAVPIGPDAMMSGKAGSGARDRQTAQRVRAPRFAGLASRTVIEHHAARRC